MQRSSQKANLSSGNPHSSQQRSEVSIHSPIHGFSCHRYSGFSRKHPHSDQLRPIPKQPSRSPSPNIRDAEPLRRHHKPCKGHPLQPADDGPMLRVIPRIDWRDAPSRQKGRHPPPYEQTGLLAAAVPARSAYAHGSVAFPKTQKGGKPIGPFRHN